MKPRAIGRIADDIDLDGDEITIQGPITKKTYTINEVMLSGDELVLRKSKFNQRKLEYLSMSSVNDIYQDIVNLKRNTTPILAVGTQRDFRIISGLRRAFCIANSKNTTAVIHLLAEIDPADEQALAISSDLHQKPTPLDKALSLIERDDFEQLMAMPVRELGKMLGVSKSQAAILKNAVSVPFDVYNLFPNIKFIEISLINEITKFGLEALKSACKSVKQYSYHLTPEQLTLHDKGELPDEIYAETYKQVKAELKLTLNAITKLPADILECIESTRILNNSSLDLLLEHNNETTIEACGIAKERAQDDPELSETDKAKCFENTLKELLVDETDHWKSFDVKNNHVTSKVNKSGDLVLTISNSLSESDKNSLAELIAKFDK